MNKTYQNTGSMNWREIVRMNRRRTIYVLLSFLAIYCGLGLLFDLYLLENDNFEPAFLIGFFIVSSLVIVLGIFFGSQASLAGTGAVQVTEADRDPAHKKLFNIVEEMKIAAGMRYMPKVYILNVDYMNAFACGWSEKNACVAVSRPLLEALTRDELQAVMAHELTHIRNQDTRLLLAVSVMANFSVFLIDVLFRSVLHGKGGSKSKDKNGALIIGVLAARILLPVLTAVLIFYLSRKREFMADAGGVELTRDNQSMANALIKIHEAHITHKNEYKEAYSNTDHESMRSLSYLYDPRASGIRNRLNLTELFSTHPPLNKRLEALGYKKQGNDR